MYERFKNKVFVFTNKYMCFRGTRARFAEFQSPSGQKKFLKKCCVYGVRFKNKLVKDI